MRLTLLVGFLLLLTAERAEAADEATMAKVHTYNQAALQAYDAGQFLTAAKAFEEALALVPDHPNAPALMFSAAQAYRLQYSKDDDPRNLSKARDFYKRYLNAAPDGSRVRDAAGLLQDVQSMLARTPTGAAERAEVEKTQLLITSQAPGALARIDGGARGSVPLAADVTAGEHTVDVEAPGFLTSTTKWLALQGRLVVAPMDLDALPALVNIGAPEDSRIFVDGVHLGRAPLKGPARIAAGEHLLTVTASGHGAATRRLDLERGQALSVAIQDMPITNQRVASILVLGGSGLASLAGVVTGFLAWDRQNAAFAARPTTHPGATSVDPFNNDVAARNSLNTATAALLGSAAVLAVTGLMLYGLDAPEVPAPPITIHGLTASATVDPGAR